MSPKFHENYKHLLKKSWSIRWAVLAGILSGLEVVLPLFIDAMPKNVFSILSFISVAGAIWARLLVQPKDGL